MFDLINCYRLSLFQYFTMADDASGSGAAGGEANARPLEGSAMTRIIVSHPVLSVEIVGPTKITPVISN